MLTDGVHPFGNPVRRETNIIDDKYTLKMTELKCQENGCLALIQSMIKHNPKERPSASAILSHHFFWSVNTTLQFLIDVASLLSKELPEATQCMARINHKQFTNWLFPVTYNRTKDICLSVSKYLKELGSCGYSVMDMVQIIGYLENNYETIPDAVKTELGNIPEEFLQYWQIRFPDLLPSVWEAFQDLRDHRLLKKYYHERFKFPQVLGTHPFVKFI